MKHLLALVGLVLLLSGCASSSMKIPSVKNVVLPPMPVLKVYNRASYTTNILSESIIVSKDDRFIFKFPTIVNGDYIVNYTVQQSPTPVITNSWTNVMYVVGNGNSYSYTEHATNKAGFFRLKVDFVKK